MGKQMNTGKAFVTFLLGGAVGAGAAFLMSRACKMKGSTAGAAASRPGGADTEAATPLLCQCRRERISAFPSNSAFSRSTNP